MLTKALIKLLESLAPLGSSSLSLQPSSLPLAPFSLYLFQSLWNGCVTLCSLMTNAYIVLTQLGLTSLIS